ncbi:PAS-domain containing protein [Pararhodobacter sp.]|uniref:PAS-domain containing protein n=1 Tax=Pararhodobacter sp. TaxID=2127056 RepID=UPI002FDC8227
MQNPLIFAIILVVTSALTALAVVMIASALTRRPKRADNRALGLNRLDPVFLFDDTRLVDANDRGASLLDALAAAEGMQRSKKGTESWRLLSRFLVVGFPDLTEQLASLSERGKIQIPAQDTSGLRLQAEWLDGTARLTLTDTAADEGSVMLDRLSYRAMEEELAVLRRVTDRSPILTWRENVQGQVIWANGAYLRQLAESGLGESFNWPLPRLFLAGAIGPEERVALPGTVNGRQRWFDITRMADEKGQLVFALPADEAQRAERTKREFIQTLTKTFATLPIGLAVFDRTRRLQLFNPALTDLTGLEPEFLLSRPGIEGFLNRMRDKRVLPEPRDYHSWSKRLLEIEKGAANSDFEETWSLPTGQTFRVSASPHPDGALAFLIEDITSEVHMTRNFRTDLETSQAALNILDTALAVFTQNGQLILTNAAFNRLWTLEGDDTLAGFTLSDALANWREDSEDPALWNRIAELSRPGAAPGLVSGVMQLDDGECLAVSAQKVSNNTVVIAFDRLEDIADESPATPHMVAELPETFEAEHEVNPRRTTSYRGAQVIRASA